MITHVDCSGVCCEKMGVGIVSRRQSDRTMGITSLIFIKLAPPRIRNVQTPIKIFSGLFSILMFANCFYFKNNVEKCLFL